MKMNSKRAILASLFGLTLGFSSTGHAGCLPPQLTGFWEMAFSDGNSCRLKLNSNGVINVDQSVCYDPNRGATAPDSGNLKVQPNCFAEGELVVEGFTIELPVQFSQSRGMAAGRYRVTADGTKGSVVLVRVP